MGIISLQGRRRSYNNANIPMTEDSDSDAPRAGNCTIHIPLPRYPTGKTLADIHRINHSQSPTNFSPLSTLSSEPYSATSTPPSTIASSTPKISFPPSLATQTSTSTISISGTPSPEPPPSTTTSSTPINPSSTNPITTTESTTDPLRRTSLPNVQDTFEFQYYLPHISTSLMDLYTSRVLRSEGSFEDWERDIASPKAKSLHLPVIRDGDFEYYPTPTSEKNGAREWRMRVRGVVGKGWLERVWRAVRVGRKR